MDIRFARPEDAPDLLAIYGQYISTIVTFEYELPSRAEFVRRIEAFSAFYPYLVAEEDGRIIGYAYAHPIGERAAFGWGAELSVYLDRACSGRGLGRRLYGTLMELLRLQGVRTVYGLVAHPNPASEALHTAMGFHLMGNQKNAGFKNGQWIDLLWYERAILPYDLPPAPVRSVHELDGTSVRAILQNER